MEHGHEANAPGIAGCPIVLVDQDGHVAIDLLRKFGVGPATEDRAGPSIGI